MRLLSDIITIFKH